MPFVREAHRKALFSRPGGGSRSPSPARTARYSSRTLSEVPFEDSRSHSQAMVTVLSPLEQLVKFRGVQITAQGPPLTPEEPRQAVIPHP